MRCIGRSINFHLERLKLEDGVEKMEKRVLNRGEEP
jgi:hypothetical protein